MRWLIWGDPLGCPQGEWRPKTKEMGQVVSSAEANSQSISATCSRNAITGQTAQGGWRFGVTTVAGCKGRRRDPANS